MKLIDDWRRVLRNAWSIKFAIASAVLGALEVVVALGKPAWIPSGAFAALAFVASAGGGIARVMAQKEKSTPQGGIPVPPEKPDALP